MGSILQLCNKGILLNNGMLNFCGEIRETVDFYLSKKNISALYYTTKDTEMYISSIRLLNENKEPIQQHAFDKTIAIEWNIHVNSAMSGATLGFNISSKEETIIFSENHTIDTTKVNNNTYKIYAFIKSHFLMPGSYILNTAIHIPNVRVLDVVYNKIGFEIIDTGSLSTLLNTNIGFINANTKWKYEEDFKKN
jgi:lipopolysaccharide transport system ATP-binding protein